MSRPVVNISEKASRALDQICSARNEKKGDYVNRMIIKEHEETFEELTELRKELRAELKEELKREYEKLI
jgi:F0F1-type ATP synthase membrane subunit b/b'